MYTYISLLFLLGCPHMSNPDNGHLESNQSDQSNQSDRYRNMVYAKQKLMCNHGYIASTATITCTGNLTWSPTVVTCNPTFSTGNLVKSNVENVCDLN